MRWSTVLAVALCAGCGGGGGSPANGPAPFTGPAPPNPPVMAQQSAGGLWFAAAGASGGTTLMIAETGDLKVSMAPTATSGPAFGHGAVTVAGDRVEGSFQTRAIPLSPTGQPGVELNCTVSGTASTRVSLQLTTLQRRRRCHDDDIDQFHVRRALRHGLVSR